tara:strand:- start:106 stop:318 length:213 start_codon:yes stop_codon:yes gene_type:complete
MEGRAKPYSRLKLVAHAAHSYNVTGMGGVGFNFGAKSADMDIYKPPIPEIVVAPNLFEKVFAAENFAYLV